MLRSTIAGDYQDVARPVAVMAKDFAPGAATGWHSHPRAQLLHATAGLMMASTARGTWVVPVGHALLIPPGLEHNIDMHGPVAMRTAYLSPEAVAAPLECCRVLWVTALLRAALLALAEEPALYDATGRGGHLAAIVLDEIARAPDASYALPMPGDARLRRMCRALIDDPSLDRDIDAWAIEVGMSRRSLTRRFRDETGLSFGAWRRRARLLAALARQANGETLRDIAPGVGYADPRALDEMMKRTAAAAA
jgi:AraC-like DNA-binding protein